MEGRINKTKPQSPINSVRINKMGDMKKRENKYKQAGDLHIIETKKKARDIQNDDTNQEIKLRKKNWTCRHNRRIAIFNPLYHWLLFVQRFFILQLCSYFFISAHFNSTFEVYLWCWFLFCMIVWLSVWYFVVEYCVDLFVYVCICFSKASFIIFVWFIFYDISLYTH